MNYGVYKIAGCVFGLESVGSAIHNEMRGYRSDEQPEISIAIGEGDIAAERARSELEGSASDNVYESLAAHRKLSDALLERNVLLMHCSAVAVDGAAYLFTAKSGVGKSTHARFWREKFGERAVMVNDDKPYLMMTPDGVFVCGSPWSGKERLNANVQVPLKAVCLLRRGSENSIREISAREAMPFVYRQTYRPDDERLMERSFALTARLLDSARLYVLKCTPTIEAADVAWKGMSGEDE